MSKIRIKLVEIMNTLPLVEEEKIINDVINSIEELSDDENVYSISEVKLHFGNSESHTIMIQYDIIPIPYWTGDE